MTQDLKQCQCGYYPTVYYNGGKGNEGHAKVQCDDCGMNTGYNETEEQSVRTWNTRAQPDVDVEELAGKIAVAAAISAYNNKGKYDAEIYIEVEPIQDLLHQALTSAQPDGWQPIDTAPRDERYIHVYDGDEVTLAQWVDSNQRNSWCWQTPEGYVVKPISWTAYNKPQPPKGADDKIRFFHGRPEKIGGWQKDTEQ